MVELQVVGLGLIQRLISLFFSSLLFFFLRKDTPSHTQMRVMIGGTGIGWNGIQKETHGLLTLAAFSFVPNCVTGDSAKAMILIIPWDGLSLECLFSASRVDVVQPLFISSSRLTLSWKTCQTLVHPPRETSATPGGTSIQTYMHICRRAGLLRGPLSSVLSAPDLWKPA